MKRDLETIRNWQKVSGLYYSKTLNFKQNNILKMSLKTIIHSCLLCLTISIANAQKN